MVFFGVLLFIVAIATFVMNKIGFIKVNKKVSMAIGIASVLFILLPFLFFFAERGYSYVLVYPNGNMKAVQTQGLVWRGFAKIDDWQNYIDVKSVTPEVYANRFNDQTLSELEGVMVCIPVRFIDQVTADGYISCRFELPNNPDKFLELAVKYRTMKNLVDNTIIPTIREQLTNTGYMYAAQNYISGESQAFRQAFEEQLKSGTYAVQKLEYKDTIYEHIGQAQRKIKEIQTRYEVKKIEINGKPQIIQHELTMNNIIVSQVIVDNIDLEGAFKKRLESQRDESAKRQLEQQKIETAKAAQMRIIAEGERDKSAERVTQEKQQVKALIEIETKLKQESTNRELAVISLETERLNSQKKKVAADAQFYENQKLVQAGLTPQERAEWDYKTKVGVSAEVSKIKFPQYMIIGGDKNGSTNPIEALIGTAMAKQILQEK